MMTRITQVLHQAGVTPDDIALLAAQVVNPSPGSIDPTEWSSADDVTLALLAGIVAGTNIRRFGQALQALLARVDAAQTALSDYDSARFWHLKGLAAWRQETSVYRAMRAWNRSVELLEGLHSQRAQGYLARVFDTFGQMLHHQGLLCEARLEFERALRLRQAVGDTLGEAWTLGNLGRLCMELGDFEAATAYIARDLALVEQHTPEQTRLRAQLLSHLGTCALERGQGPQAQDYFMQSAGLAQRQHDAYGLAFIALGLGRVALQGHDLDLAERQATAAWEHLVGTGEPVDNQEGLRGLILQLRAEVYLQRRDAGQAVETFAMAHVSFQRTSRLSVVEMARFLYGYAQAHRANGEDEQAASRLREALQRLDASTAEPLRQEIEGLLRTHFQESWLLHTASRFIGQTYMDFLLEHAGGSAFRGERQDVVILFADLRDFTTLTEHFAAEPEAFVTILNDYLRHMTRCIEHCGGIVCQFNGDGIMAVFSLPVPQPASDAERAVRAALMMQEALTQFCRSLRDDMPRLTMGVGLHAGPVIAGLFGSPQKRVYTVNGDAANTASRLEGLTKHLGASIVISTEVARRLTTPEQSLLRPLGRYRLKGKATPVDVVEVMGEDDGSRWAQALTTEIAQVHQALRYFQQELFAEASAAFATLAAATTRAGQGHRTRGYQFLAATAAAYQATFAEVLGGVPALAFEEAEAALHPHHVVAEAACYRSVVVHLDALHKVQGIGRQKLQTRQELLQATHPLVDLLRHLSVRDMRVMRLVAQRNEWLNGPRDHRLLGQAGATPGLEIHVEELRHDQEITLGVVLL